MVIPRIKPRLAPSLTMTVVIPFTVVEDCITEKSELGFYKLVDNSRWVSWMSLPFPDVNPNLITMDPVDMPMMTIFSNVVASIPASVSREDINCPAWVTA
jgi:hypothetical protein